MTGPETFAPGVAGTIASAVRAAARRSGHGKLFIRYELPARSWAGRERIGPNRNGAAIHNRYKFV